MLQIDSELTFVEKFARYRFNNSELHFIDLSKTSDVLDVVMNLLK